MRVKSIIELIGNTPILEAEKLKNKLKLKGNLFLKLEQFNPFSSVKDRVGFSMINDAEKSGKLTKNTIIIEPTSGNTGIGLAFVAAAKGYKLIITMPETMSLERVKILQALGAKVILTEGSKGIQGSLEKAEELHKQNKNSIILQQFENKANPQIHRETTAQEILKDMNGKVDVFVASVGTGGTITGIGEVLKKNFSNVKIVAVEPKDSPVLSGGKPGFHQIQGIGAGFVPKILNTKIFDEIIQVEFNNAVETSRMLAKTEGVLSGISSGAALWAGILIAKRKDNLNKNIVVLLPDTGERYLSTNLF